MTLEHTLTGLVEFEVGSSPVWFKKDMEAAILKGAKSATTRDHRLRVGLHTAVSGSRYKRRMFAIIEVTDSIKTTWDSVIFWHYLSEGFMSPDEMRKWLTKERLLKTTKQLYYHPFRLVRALDTEPVTRAGGELRTPPEIRRPSKVVIEHTGSGHAESANRVGGELQTGPVPSVHLQ